MKSGRRFLATLLSLILGLSLMSTTAFAATDSSLGDCEIESLTNTSDGITIKWNKVTGAKGYYIYRKAESNDYSKIETISKNSTVSYDDTTVRHNNGKTYTYKVVPYAGSKSDGSYKGKKIVRMTAPTVKSVKSSRAKKMTVKWKKNSEATGYQIRYSTSKSFKNAKTVTIKKGRKVKKTISRLKKGRRYYVQIRAYKTVSDNDHYSAWSTRRSVKVEE